MGDDNKLPDLTIDPEDGMILIRNKRVSFPHFWTKPSFGKDGDAKTYSGKLMLHKEEDKEVIAELRKYIIDLQKENDMKLSPDKLCLRDGDGDTYNDRPEYNDHYILSMNSKKRPMVMAANGKDQIESEEDCAIYSGCRINAYVQIWAQTGGKFGKRINCKVAGVQFEGDDEALDGGHIDPEKVAKQFGAVDTKPFGKKDTDDNDGEGEPEGNDGYTF